MARWKAINWTRYHQIFSRLAEMGHNVYVLQPPSSKMKETNFQEIDIDVPKNLHLIDVKLNPLIWNIKCPLSKLIKKGYYSIACKNAVKECIKKYNIDVLFLYNIPQFPLLKENRCIKIFDFADDYLAMLKHELGPLSNPFILKLAQTTLDKMIKKSDLTLVVSTVLANKIKSNKDNIKVLPNGAALEPVTSGKISGVSQYQRPVIGFIGSFEYFIDFDLILGVAEKLPQATFLLVGGGRDFETVKNKIKKNNLKNVVLSGPVPHNMISGYINEMDICLNVFKDTDVSHSACPIKLFEYLLMKKPVISNRLREVQLIDKGFIFYADTVEEFISQIKIILDKKTLAAEYAERGYDIAIKEYSWENIASKLLKLIEEKIKYSTRLGINESIAIIGEFPPPEGGMAIQAKLLYEKLSEEGINVVRLKRNCEFSGRLACLGKIKILRGIISFIIFKLRLIKTLILAQTLYIFSNSFLSFYLYTLIPVALGKLLGKKIIINFHGGAAENFFNKKINFLARWALSRTDYLTVPSGYLKDIFGKLGYNAVVVPNILDLQKFIFKERSRLSPRLIITRHLEPEYNIGMTIRAFSIIKKKYPDAALQICGSGSEESRLKKLTDELGISDAVEFLGSVPNNKIAALYSTANILLNSSNVDNLPVSILEAFACGLPVVTTKAGGIPYLVEDNKTGLLVDLNDAETMAKSVIKLLDNPDLAKKLAESAKDNLTRYSWKNVREKLYPLLASQTKIPFWARIYQNLFFSIFDLLRGRKNLEKLQFLRKSQYWPKEDLAKWQINKLNELLAIARDKSPFYRERLKNVELPFTNLNELQNIPVLTKKDIRQNMENIKCEGVPKELFILGKTGGSTGEPMHYFYDKRGRDWNRGSVYRSQEWSGTFLGEKTLQMTGSHYDQTEFAKLKSRIILSLQRYKYLSISFVNDELLEKYYQELIRYKPTSIWGYSSAIYLFAKFIEEKHKGENFDTFVANNTRPSGRDKERLLSINPEQDLDTRRGKVEGVDFIKAIITSSETLFDNQRKKINEVFGTGKVFDHYGSREMYIASECAEHHGYHIHSETVIVEVVDQTGKPKNPGELGRILITDLSNQVFPFIRYEIGDVGVMTPEEYCPCGITLPKLAKVEGRIADVLVLPDRMLTAPNFTILLSDYTGIEEYQIIQKSKTELILNIVKNFGFKPEYEKYIKKSLKGLIGPTVNIAIEYVNSIGVPASGKRKYVISEIGGALL